MRVVDTVRTTAPVRTRPYAGNGQATGAGPLSGSLLSTHTWKQAFAAATGRNRDVS